MISARRLPYRRSIPARTGEPKGANGVPFCHTVYPRAYGGTPRRSALSRAVSGLSPRVRGNRAGAMGAVATTGSIPARTGEPRGGQHCRGQSRVYPRAYGGTARARWAPWRRPGLSPRVRRNLEEYAQVGAYDRSIPARTGEPRAVDFVRAVEAVYPRAYGGTIAARSEDLSAKGLSPRVRGNLG